LNFRYQGSWINCLTSLKGDSYSVNPVRIGGVWPSQNVIMQTKFSAMSLPKSLSTSAKIYFYEAVSLTLDPW